MDSLDLKNLNAGQEIALQDVLKMCRTLGESHRLKMADIFFVELAKMVGQRWQEFESVMKQ
jgi:hypothetical protein